MRAIAKCLPLFAAIGLVAGAAGAAEYYVGGTNADDTNDGSASAPWATIQKAADVVPPGSVVWVGPGQYGRTTIQRGGEANRLVVFKAVNPPAITFPDGSNAQLDNPSMTARTQGFTIDASFVRIEGFEITKIETNRGGILFFSNVDRVEIAGNFIHHLVCTLSQNDGIAVRTGIMPTAVTIANNVFWRVEGVGLNIQGHGWVVEGNDVSHGSTFQWDYAEQAVEAGLPMDQWDTSHEVTNDSDASRFFGTGHVIRSNRFHDYILTESGWYEGKNGNPNPGPHMDGFMTFTTGGLPGASDVLIEGNDVANIGHQIIMISDEVEQTTGVDDVHDLTVRNNVFRNAGAHALNIYDVKGLTLANNVIANSRYAAIQLRARGGMSKGCWNAKVVNNILYQNGNGSVLDDALSQSGSEWDHNLHFPDFGFPQKIPGHDANGLFGSDPKFVDSPSGDFHLASGSPAIDKGAAVPGFAADKDGVFRPQGTSWDIGAYEYCENGNCTAAPPSSAGSKGCGSGTDEEASRAVLSLALCALAFAARRRMHVA